MLELKFLKDHNHKVSVCCSYSTFHTHFYTYTIAHAAHSYWKHSFLFFLFRCIHSWQVIPHYNIIYIIYVVINFVSMLIMNQTCMKIHVVPLFICQNGVERTITRHTSNTPFCPVYILVLLWNKIYQGSKLFNLY